MRVRGVDAIRAKINNGLLALGLPEEVFDAETREEVLYLRLYDIERFGGSSDPNIRRLFYEREMEAIYVGKILLPEFNLTTGAMPRVFFEN